MIKAVLFDLDGVLIDSEYRTLMIKKNLFDQFGLSYDDTIYTKLAGSKLSDVFRDIWPDYPKTEEFLEYYHQVAYHDVHYQNLGMKNSSDLLHRLKKEGYRLALVTASDKEKIRQVLSELDWEDIFEFVISREEGYPQKPDPTVYKVAIEKMGLPKEQCIIVEDSQTGLQAAKGSGAKVICRKETRYPVNQKGADYYVNDLLDLFEFLN